MKNLKSTLALALLLATTTLTLSCNTTNTNSQNNNTKHIIQTPKIAHWRYDFDVKKMKYKRSICTENSIKTITHNLGEEKAKHIKNFVDTTTFKIIITDQMQGKNFTNRLKPTIAIDGQNTFTSKLATLEITKIRIGKHANNPSVLDQPTAKVIVIEFDYKITTNITEENPKQHKTIGSSTFYLRINAKNATPLQPA